MFEDGETQGAKKQRESREIELLTMRNIMQTENGRAFMYSCLQKCFTFESIFNADTHLQAFDAGKRDHGVWLDAELQEAAPDYYFKMLKENR